MRDLGHTEIEAISGGYSVFGVTEIETGLKLMSQARAVLGHAAAVFGLGYGLGTILYDSYGLIMGDSLGGDIYDLFHSGGC